MFALDLFNTDHERRLAEGAVDRLEQRRIDDLAAKMDDLVARAKQVKDPAHKAALMKEFQKCKAERDSYFKIKDECMGYGGLVGEADSNVDPTAVARVKQLAAQYDPKELRLSHVKHFAKETGMAVADVCKILGLRVPVSMWETEQEKGPRPEDIPAYLRKQQGRAPLTPQQVKAPSPGTISHADVLQKNIGSRDEIEEGFGPVGSKALMNGNLATFMKARASRQPVTLDIGGEQFRLTPAIMDAMACLLYTSDAADE